MIKSFTLYLFKTHYLMMAVLGIFLFNTYAYGSACCGGGFSAPSLITGDDQAQLTSSYSFSKVAADVSSSGVWQKRNTEDQTQIVKVEGATIYNDRYQFGFSLPFHQRNLSGPQGGATQGLGDTLIQAGYEYLPDWDYHPWRPKGIGYLSLTLPTGKSIYEEDNLNGLNSRGRGFWALGAGTWLTKNFNKIDLFTSLEIHRSFSKNVSTSQLQGTINPGYGYSYTVGIGYNWKKFRLGHSISWAQEDAVNTEGSINSQGQEQRVATGSLSLSYLFENQLSGNLTYSDQAWYGDPTNTGLNKTLLVSLQKRWPR